MLAAYLRTSQTRRPAGRTVYRVAAASGSTTPVSFTPPLPSRSVYGENQGPSWPVIAAIVAAHIVLLVALATLDVIPMPSRTSAPTEVLLIPLEVRAPPPAAKQPPADEPVVTPPPTIVAPPAIVALPSTVAPPVQVAPSPPSPAPTAAPSAPAALDGPAAPVSAPDGTAKTLGNPAPKYPIQARRAHHEGTVRLRVLISPEGRVREIAVARSSGHDSLDDAALEAVRRWRFLPGLQSGRPVEAVGYLNIPFRLATA